MIWDSFDDLLLLTRGGKVAYMGEMGPKSARVTDYFAGKGGENATGSCGYAGTLMYQIYETSKI